MNAITIQRMEIRELAEILNIDVEEFPLDKLSMSYCNRYVINIFKLEEMLKIDSNKISISDFIKEKYGDRALQLIENNI